MSVLNKLQLTQSTERAKGYDPVRVRRKKLASAIQDQINLIEASESGAVYRKTKISRERDLETDDLVEVEQQRRVSPWWWVDDAGGVMFSLRYGSARLKIKDDKDTLVLPSLGHLRKLLPDLRQEVLAGGLDGPLNEAAAYLQERFTARKKPAA